MSLINLSLSDKERILFYADKYFSDRKNIFTVDKSAPSFYNDIDESNQCFPAIMEYNIDTIKVFREFLEQMWQDVTDKDLLINVIMAAAYNNRSIQSELVKDNAGKTFEPMDENNSIANDDVLSLTRYAF
jgi:hypothetical protein